MTIFQSLHLHVPIQTISTLELSKNIEIERMHHRKSKVVINLRKSLKKEQFTRHCLKEKDELVMLINKYKDISIHQEWDESTF